MTATVTTAMPVDATVSRPGSRAARLAMPRSIDVVKALAEQYGVCTRPVTLRRTSLDTGQTTIIDLPCGATLTDKCPACAIRARRLRQQQIHEGWHRTDEPLPAPEPANDTQAGLIITRAHLEFDRAQCGLVADWTGVTACDDAIREIDEEIGLAGLRGRAAPPHQRDTNYNGEGSTVRRVRSTRRREDVPDLPRKKVLPHTTGRTYGAPGGNQYRPSLFLTLTLPSYGRVLGDGTPANPHSYDYRRAAWDAIHFPRLLDRFWQNLRRAAGWNVQYAGAVEPQRRLAPHAHFAIRGTIPRDLIRTVAAATYHQVWWPATAVRRYHPESAPQWNVDTGQFVDPDTGVPLATWAQALDQVDTNPDTEPAHVIRFGEQVHAQGVLAGTPDAQRCIRYLTKYLTKHAADCHDSGSVRQQTHLDRLWHELRHTPCSPRCPNWLLYNVQPDRAHARMAPGRCKSRVHQRATLGMAGRRVLVSRQWSGKTLTDHRSDNRAWVRNLLGLDPDDNDGDHGQAAGHVWELARRDDPDITPLPQRLLRAISERIQYRNHIHAARAGPAARNVSATTEGTTATGEDHNGG